MTAKKELGSGLQYCSLAFCKTVIAISEDLIAVDIGPFLPKNSNFLISHARRIFAPDRLISAPITEFAPKNVGN